MKLALRDVYGPEYCTKGWKVFVEKVRFIYSIEKDFLMLV